MGTLKVLDWTPIGKGALSDVYKGQWNSKFVAIKRIREIGGYPEEAEILSELKHHNIIAYLETVGNSIGTYDIIFELACGGSLAGALHRKGRNAEWKRSTIHQISSGLAYVHSQGIIHLDVKPPNILFRARDLKRVLIADFGMAKEALQARRAGARKFRAPDKPFTQKSDVFSLASIACCILYWRNPASKEETERIVVSVLEQQRQDGNPIWYLALKRGVDANHKNRPSVLELCDAFKKPPAQPARALSTRVPPTCVAAAPTRPRPNPSIRGKRTPGQTTRTQPARVASVPIKPSFNPPIGAQSIHAQPARVALARIQPPPDPPIRTQPTRLPPARDASASTLRPRLLGAVPDSAPVPGVYRSFENLYVARRNQPPAVDQRVGVQRSGDSKSPPGMIAAVLGFCRVLCCCSCLKSGAE